MMLDTEIHRQDTLVHWDDTVQYALCDHCTYTYLHCLPFDTWEEYGEECQDGDMETVGFIRNFHEDHISLAEVAIYDPAGYWECECCRETMIGEGRVLEGER